MFGDGLQTRDFTYVGDVVAATRAASRGPGVEGEIYNVGGSQVSLNEAIALIEDIAGTELEWCTRQGTRRRQGHRRRHRQGADRAGVHALRP